MPKLIKKLVDKVPYPPAGQVFIRDDEMPGFALRVTPGAKTFILERRIHGRSRRLTLGRYGDLTVEEARGEATKKAGEIASGGDPAIDRQRRVRSVTFKDLEQRYLDRPGIGKRSRANDVCNLNRYLASWRSRPLASITRTDVTALHAQIGAKSIYAANATGRLLRHLFNLAIDWGLFHGENPARRIKFYRETKRDRFVTPAELPRLWTALQAEPNVYVRGAFFLGLLTGARRNEVLQMKWTELDFDSGVWRIPHTKADRPHYVPIPRAVLDELVKLPRLKDNPHVFPGRWGKKHLVNVSKPWKAIRARAKLEDVRLHDLRRTLGSWLAASGASLPLIGKALNHSQPNTTAIYARLQLDPVREALEANAARMLAVVTAPTAKRRGHHR